MSLRQGSLPILTGYVIGPPTRGSSVNRAIVRLTSANQVTVAWPTAALGAVAASGVAGVPIPGSS